MGSRQYHLAHPVWRNRQGGNTSGGMWVNQFTRCLEHIANHGTGRHIINRGRREQCARLRHNNRIQRDRLRLKGLHHRSQTRAVTAM